MAQAGTHLNFTGRGEVPVFSVKGLHCGFEGHEVLKELDWSLEADDSFAIVGPSGEGKSLFLKVLAGLIADYRGSVRYCGYEINKMTARQRRDFRKGIGMTFQRGGLFDSVTCAQNLRFLLQERLTLTPAEREKEVARALDEVELTGQGGLMVHEMSGGMQKRLGIARALLFTPNVILYDEPAAGLDPLTAQAINDLIARSREQHGMSVVLVSSDLWQAQQIASRAGLLWRGAFEQQGDWKTLMASNNAAVHQFFHVLAYGPLTAEHP